MFGHDRWRPLTVAVLVSGAVFLPQGIASAAPPAGAACRQLGGADCTPAPGDGTSTDPVPGAGAPGPTPGGPGGPGAPGSSTSSSNRPPSGASTGGGEPPSSAPDENGEPPAGAPSENGEPPKSTPDENEEPPSSTPDDNNEPPSSTPGEDRNTPPSDGDPGAASCPPGPGTGSTSLAPGSGMPGAVIPGGAPSGAVPVEPAPARPGPSGLGGLLDRVTAATSGVFAATSGAASSVAGALLGAAGSTGANAKLPGELIDLGSWYLTLPTGKAGDPDTVENPDLPTFTNEFFKLNDTRNGVVFSANGDGVTTKNSKYPRSELREMNGGEKAAWSNTSGTHTLDVCEAITKVPSTKPEVVAAQIHDGNDDVLQIRLEGEKLMVQYDDGKSESIIDPAYKLGTPYHVRIVAADSKVDVLYNGEKKAELPLSGSGWYWKVGAYVQSNASKGDGADSVGEVTVYALKIVHA